MPMEAILRELNSVVGVTGSFVCLNDASVAGCVLPDSFDAARVGLAARVASQTFLALETSGQRVVEADLTFEQARVILRNVRGGILVILCARQINLPLLNLTANLAAKKIATELTPPKARPPAPVAAAAPTGSAPQPQATPAAPLPVIEPAIGQSTEIVAEPPEPVDGKFFDQLTRELARIMGPAASLVIEDEISALKETRATFPKARVAELVERASGSIRDETKRVQFQRVMAEVIRNPSRQSNA